MPKLMFPCFLWSKSLGRQQQTLFLGDLQVLCFNGDLMDISNLLGYEKHPNTELAILRKAVGCSLEADETVCAWLVKMDDVLASARKKLDRQKNK